MEEVPELTPLEVARRWPEGRDGAAVVLLDVREPDEVERASIAGALHVPMGEVPARLSELQKDNPIVVFCHMGGRSRRVAQFLAAHGFGRVFNLEGGIEAWSCTLDSSVPRY